MACVRRGEKPAPKPYLRLLPQVRISNHHRNNARRRLSAPSVRWIIGWLRAFEKALDSHTRRTVLQVLRLEEEAQQRLNALQPTPRHHARVAKFFHTMTDMHASRPFMHHQPPRRPHLSRLTLACVACPLPLPRAIAWCNRHRGDGCMGSRVPWWAKVSLA